jgi:hypothetical protein
MYKYDIINDHTLSLREVVIGIYEGGARQVLATNYCGGSKVQRGGYPQD